GSESRERFRSGSAPPRPRGARPRCPLKPSNLRNVCRSTAEGSREWMPHGYGINFTDGRTVTVHGPRTSIMGDGASAEAGRVLRSWGLEKGVRVVLVADAEVARLGLTAPALNALHGEGFAVEVFSDIAGEPDLDMAVRVVDFVRGHNPAAVVGVGGGSALDLAK